MLHYKIRAIPERLRFLFESQLNNVCFCINDKSMDDDGACDVVAIPKNLKVEKLIKDNFFYIKSDVEKLEYSDRWPDYFYFPKMGNPKLLGLPRLLQNKFTS